MAAIFLAERQERLAVRLSVEGFAKRNHQHCSSLSVKLAKWNYSELEI